VGALLTRQTASLRASTHCPSQGRRGGPWRGSRAARGRRRCMSRRGVVSARRSGACQATGTVQEGVCWQRTCWLMSRIAMSLRSEVKRSKAASMAALSVFASTTRKFFCASGGDVTCWTRSVAVAFACSIAVYQQHSRQRRQAACPSPCPAGGVSGWAGRGQWQHDVPRHR
jgi:uncharacterized protein YjhX (UPF0386 family)